MANGLSVKCSTSTGRLFLRYIHPHTAVEFSENACDSKWPKVDSSYLPAGHSPFGMIMTSNPKIPFEIMNSTRFLENGFLSHNFPFTKALLAKSLHL